MIKEVRPTSVLVEAPADLAPLIPLLLDPKTRPPVAIATLIDRAKDSRLAAYLPFCAHSPELVALQEGHRLGAELAFIDLPTTRMSRLCDAPEGEAVAIAHEDRFDSGDYVAALARRTGCRDGFELWDYLFEVRLGCSDWRGFFEAVGTYCAGLRAATPAAEIAVTGDLAREAHMAQTIRTALNRGPVVVVAGGFHVPALLDPSTTPSADPPAAVGKVRSYLIRYGFAAMDALSGYAAGLPQPAYYDDLWRAANAAKGAPVWERTALELGTRFARAMREEGHAIPVPAQVEMLRVAAGLAAMRGRPGASRHDLIDAVRAALVKGEAGLSEVWTERLLTFLRGTALGEVPPSAGSPPLVEDARHRCAALKLNIGDSALRRRSLDIRRKPAHLAASQFLHGLELLEAAFATRQSGPDYINGARTDLLFEEWSYAWTPAVEGRLIEAAVLGDDVPAACLGVLDRARRAQQEAGQARDLTQMTTLLSRGLLAGLGVKLAPFVTSLADEIRLHGAFEAVADALRQVHALSLSTGPLAIPDALDIQGLRSAAYTRILYLIDDLPQTKPEMVAARVMGLRVVLDVLRGPGGDALERDLFDDAVARIAEASPPPQILGAVLAVSLISGRRGARELVAALEGNFHGSLPDIEGRIGVLRGLSAVSAKRRCGRRVRNASSSSPARNRLMHSSTPSAVQRSDGATEIKPLSTPIRPSISG
ncbi:MAG: DUF5682 family protein, partial [Pseudomonadota bacterium]